MDGNSDGVAKSPCVELAVRSIRIELKDTSAVSLFGLLALVVDICFGANRSVELCSVPGKDDVARPMPSARQSASGRELGNALRLAARLKITVTVGKSHDAVGIGDIEKLRIRSGGIKRKTEWLRQAGCEFLIDVGTSVSVGIAQHADRARGALRHKDVAVRGRAQISRVIKLAREEIHIETFWHTGFGAFRGGDNLRRVESRRRRIVRWQIREHDLMPHTGGVRLPVARLTLTSQRLVLCDAAKRGQRATGGEYQQSVEALCQHETKAIARGCRIRGLEPLPHFHSVIRSALLTALDCLLR